MTRICLECIGDDYLLENRADFHDSISECDYCHNERRFCIEANNLAELLRPLINIYTPNDEFMPTEQLKDNFDWGETIYDKLRGDWELFSELEDSALEKLFQEMFYSKDDSNLILDSFIEDELEYFGENDETTKELEIKWKEFCDEIISNNRYFPKKSIDLDVMEELIKLVETEIPKGVYFYRGRIWEVKDSGFTLDKMGIPPAEKSRPGRANPIGIPYLYVASDERTAIAEIRPTVLDKVSIAKLQLNDDLRIINLKNLRSLSPFQFGDDIRSFVLYQGFLAILSNELSKPIHPNLSNLEYIPLQYLCELIKNLGYDGVTYNSSVGEGYNLAAFSENKFYRISVHNFEVVDLDYSTKIISTK